MSVNEEVEVHQVGAGEVCKQHTESYRHEKQRLELTDYRKIEQNPDYNIHYEILPPVRAREHLCDAR